MEAAAGDVIYVERNGYNHYGIYSGNNKVIHYVKTGTLDGTIKETSLKKFLDGAKNFYVVELQLKNNKELKRNITKIPIMSSTISLPRIALDFSVELAKVLYKKLTDSGQPPQIFTPEETIERARGEIGKKGYNLIVHNCEHFSIWCKTGIYESKQVENILNGVGDIIHIYTIIKHMRRL